MSSVVAIPFVFLTPLVLAPKVVGAPFFFSYLRMQLLLLRVICGISYKVTGWENLPETPFIFASQHQATWENLFFQYILGNPVMFAKKEIFSYPIVGMLARKNGHILVDRKGSIDRLRSAFHQAKDMEGTNRNFLIYPVGTRKPEAWGKIQSGVGVLYQLLGRPVVPVLLDSAKCWPYGTWMKYSGIIQVKLQPAIEPEMPRRKFVHELSEILSKRL